MKITFTADHTPKGQAEGRPTYKAGETHEFKGPVAETYAQKYIARGWAVPAVEKAPEKLKPEPVVETVVGPVETDAPTDEPTAEPDAAASEPARERKKGRGRF